MKITICGSTAFIENMEKLARELETLGHEVKLPPSTVIDGDGKEWSTVDYYNTKKEMAAKKSLAPNPHPSVSTPLEGHLLLKGEGSNKNADAWFWENHTQRIRNHFDKVVWGEAILVTNFHKNNVAHYIGPNTLMEMGLAFHLGKKIFLLHPVPEINYKEEILGMRPIVVNGDLVLII